MGAVLTLLVICALAVSITLSSVAISRSQSSGTTTQIVASRIVGGGGIPTVALTGNTNVIEPPTMASNSSDVAGTILSQGKNSASGVNITITLTFAVPYPEVPSAVLVNVIDVVMSQQGIPPVTWTKTGFTFTYNIHDPIPNNGTVPFWTYLVIG